LSCRLLPGEIHASGPDIKQGRLAGWPPFRNPNARSSHAITAGQVTAIPPDKEFPPFATWSPFTATLISNFLPKSVTASATPVQRAVYAEIPPRVEYSLTQKGRTLEPVISALAAWGRSADEPADAPGAS